MDTEKAKYLLEQAFEEDADNNKEEAFELYAQAAELFLKLVGIRKDFLQLKTIRYTSYSTVHITVKNSFSVEERCC